ncbi:HNH endonuclease [Sphingomonas faeni]|jgi:uncharacterized protein (TIGR02646 family)|uniref:HNH endonuclease n=1 Tax=Sphingomonas faeni TaxID=185950 RepID=UPI0033542EBC
MRPVQKQPSPQTDPFDPYETAKNHLLGRLGSYCSYCERKIVTNLAVEHIQPKGLPAFAHLETDWTNFLLACVNCNSTKGHQPVLLDDVLLPDRDNTFLAYEYTIDGRVRVTPGLAPPLATKAQALLTLTGLDRKLNSVLDENGKQIVVDRVSGRAEIMAIALDQVAEIAADPSNQGVKRSTVRMANATGGFSVWMAAFAGDADMQERLIDAFAGTRASGCFGTAGHTTVSPHPNTDGLSSGGRI